MLTFIDLLLTEKNDSLNENQNTAEYLNTQQNEL